MEHRQVTQSDTDSRSEYASDSDASEDSSDGGHNGMIPNDYNCYSRLDPTNKEIRVLHILPAEDSQDLTVVLLRTTLDMGLRYRALSYTWGKLTRTAQIQVVFEDDVSTDQDHIASFEDSTPQAPGVAFKITKHSCDALRSFCEHDREPIFYWIDMLCINQGDLVERSEQVELMKEIYTSATQVNIWLGKEDSDSEAWLADENAELMVFMAALRDNGYGRETSTDTGIIQLYRQFMEDLRSIELPADSNDAPGLTNLNQLDRSMQLQFVVMRQLEKGRAPPQDSHFFPLLMKHLPAIRRLKQKAMQKEQENASQGYRLESSNAMVRFFFHWLVGVYVDGATEAQLEAYATYYYIFESQFSEVHQLLTSVLGEMRTKEEDKVAIPKSYASARLKRMLKPYFTRVWVLQEVVSNCNAFVRIGSESADVNIFCVLRALERERATDPRDRVFATYQLASDCKFDSFRPDYTQSVEQIYAQFTKHAISATGRADILLSWPDSRETRSPVLELPSWTPDYRRVQYETIDEFRASLDSTAVLRSLPDPTCLSLKGTLISEVSYVVPSLLGDPEEDSSMLIAPWKALRTAYIERIEPPPNQKWPAYLEDSHLLAAPVIGNFANLLFEGRMTRLVCLWKALDRDLAQIHGADAMAFKHILGQISNLERGGEVDLAATDYVR